MPSERLGLRAWLEEKLNRQEYRGVKWIDPTNGTFSISWKHASRHGWVEHEDAAIFKDWAIHTGRYIEDHDTPNPKTWKANFRCAMNASRDIKKVKVQSLIKGKNACRVFEFSKNRRSRVTVSQRSSSTKLQKEDTENRTHRIESRKRSNVRLARQRHKYVNVKCMVNNERKKSIKTVLNEVTPISLPRDNIPKDIHQSKQHQPLIKPMTSSYKTKESKKKNLITVETLDATTTTTTATDTTTCFTKLYENTKYLSFSELLAEIPQDTHVHNPLSLLSSSPVFEDDNSCEYQLDTDINDLLKYVDCEDITSNMNRREHGNEASCYCLQDSSSSTPDSSDAEDIAEMFESGVDYENNSFKYIEDILIPNDHHDDDDDDDDDGYNRNIFGCTELPPLSSINAPFFSHSFSSVVSDPFLSDNNYRHDIIKAMTSSFIYELQ